jgi:hypothetical protein
MTGLRRLGSERRVGSEMGRKGVYPLFFLKSADVAWNQQVVEIRKTGVCRRLKRRDLREGVKDVERGAIRNRRDEFTDECSVRESTCQ